MERIIANAIGRTRRVTVNGREFLVRPLSLIVPGVLSGSQGALYYPPEEIATNVDAWNGMPLTLGHPSKGGMNVSARSPEVIDKFGLGTVYSATYNGRLVAEGWFDLELVKSRDQRLYKKLISNETVELSTGLFTKNVPAVNGSNYRGRPYQFTARNYKPDHVAVLVDQTGACSLKDGCGVLTNAFDQPRNPDGTFASVGHANAASQKAYKSNDKAHHKEAAGAHKKAEADLRAHGEKKKSSKNQHEAESGHAAIRDANKHRDSAAHHESIAGSTLKYNRRSSQENRPMTDAEKAEAVTYITTNCKCWEGKDDVLTNLDAGQLNTIVAGIVTNEETVVEVPAPTGNKSFDDWKAGMPPEALAVWNTAVEITNNEKQRLVAGLVANAGNVTAKKAAQAVYEKLGIPELRALAAAQPAQRPTANRHEPRVNDFTLAGGITPLVNQDIVDNASDEILDIPTLNFDNPLKARSA